MIESGLFTWIENNEALDLLLPTNNSIFLGFVPESASYPCLMLEQVSEDPDTTFDGPSGFVSARYQFNCYGRDADNEPGSGYVSAKQLADTLRQQFEWMSENSPFTLPDGTYIFDVQPDTALGTYDAEAQRYHAIRDFKFQFRRNP